MKLHLRLKIVLIDIILHLEVTANRNMMKGDLRYNETKHTTENYINWDNVWLGVTNKPQEDKKSLLWVSLQILGL